MDTVFTFAYLLKNNIKLIFSVGILYSISIFCSSKAIEYLLDGSHIIAVELHFLSCLLSTAIVIVSLPLRYKFSYLFSTFVFLLCFFMPFISSVISPLFLITPFYFTKKRQKEIFESLHKKSISGNKLTKNKDDISYGEIDGILKFSDNALKRQNAVLSTKNIDNESSIPLLKYALSDKDDEVRLLAYSYLDKKEKRLDKIINDNLAKIQKNNLSNEDYFATNLLLAECYWELTYLGLAQGLTKSHALNSVIKHVEESLWINPGDAQATKLKVKALISLDKNSVAKDILNSTKFPKDLEDELNLLKAEIEFNMGNYKDVKYIIKKIACKNRNMLFNGIVSQWT